MGKPQDGLSRLGACIGEMLGTWANARHAADNLPQFTLEATPDGIMVRAEWFGAAQERYAGKVLVKWHEFTKNRNPLHFAAMNLEADLHHAAQSRGDEIPCRFPHSARITPPTEKANAHPV